MTFESYLILFTSLTILAYKPGAGFFLTISYGIKEGFWASFVFISGAALVCAVYFAVSIQAVYWGNIILDSFIILVKGMGSAYLIYLGISGLTKEKTPQQLAQVRSKPFHEYFMTGIFFEMGNPLTIIFFMTIISPMIPADEITLQMMLTLSLFVFAAQLINYGSLSLIGAVIGKKFLKRKNLFNLLDRITSIALILIGLLIAGSAIPYAFGKTFL